MVLVELFVSLVQQVGVVLVAGILGLFTHELLHWSVGYISGGSPRFINHKFGIPTSVAFDTPKLMTNRQAKLTGGIVFTFPISFAVFLSLTSPTQIFGSLYLLGVFVFLGAGCGISPTDMMTVFRTDAWKKFADGESIDLSDFGH